MVTEKTSPTDDGTAMVVFIYGILKTLLVMFFPIDFLWNLMTSIKEKNSIFETGVDGFLIWVIVVLDIMNMRVKWDI